MQKLINNSGIYVLELIPSKSIKFSHKRLGEYHLPIGFYYYIGSAQKNLNKRIARHLSKTKTQHWHIDYLTVNEDISINNVYVIKNHSKKHECNLVSTLINMFKMYTPINSFGNSDCKLCTSHLLYSKKQLSYNHLCSLYQSAVIFIPSSKETFCE